MPYTNITYASIKIAENYVSTEWVHSDETNFLKKHVLSRGVYLILTPGSFITSALDTIVGIGAGVVAIGTLGKHEPTLTAAFNHLSGSKKLVVRPYVNLLRTINPEAKFSGDFENQPYVTRYLLRCTSYKPPMISADGDGFISDIVITSLKKVARECYNSDNFLKRHVASRLTYVLLALSCLVTRAVDGVIGILAAGLSILTCGKLNLLIM